MIPKNLHKRLSRLLIIFDLDDTLIPTSEIITPFKLRKAFDSIWELAQLSLKTFEKLLELNQKASSSKEALLEFFKIFNISSSLQISALQAFHENQILPEALPAHEFANEMLKELSLSHQLALVTKGDTAYQKLKMERSSLEMGYFLTYAIVNEGSKSSAYLNNMTQFNRHPHEIVVIGDRIEVDLNPAKALGMHTIHFNNGRGRVENFTFHQDVDYQICSLRDVSGMINKIEIKNYLRKT